MNRKRVVFIGIGVAVLIIAGVVAYTILGPQRLPAPPINIAYRGETWTGFRPEVFDYTIEGDSLQLTLKTVARWAGNGQGGLVYRDVVGNFKATANVYARKGGDPNQVVSTAVSLGGLSARPERHRSGWHGGLRAYRNGQHAERHWC